jgi:hypothetical protein
MRSTTPTTTSTSPKTRRSRTDRRSATLARRNTADDDGPLRRAVFLRVDFFACAICATARLTELRTCPERGFRLLMPRACPGARHRHRHRRSSIRATQPHHRDPRVGYPRAWRRMRSQDRTRRRAMGDEAPRVPRKQAPCARTGASAGPARDRREADRAPVAASPWTAPPRQGRATAGRGDRDGRGHGVPGLFRHGVRIAPAAPKSFESTGLSGSGSATAAHR